MGGETLYCCLGVLAEIGVERGVLECYSYAGLWRFCLANDDYHLSTSGMLPERSDEWHELTGYQQEKLATMNDSGRTFTYIADWIEREL